MTLEKPANLGVPMAAEEIERSQLALVVDELAILVHETCEYQRQAESKVPLSEALRILLAMRRRLQLASRRYVVGVVGLTNVGKSTLLNALLGSELAPRRNGPCTAAPIEFVFGPEYEVTAYYRQSLRRPRWQCADIESIHARLTALADDEGAEASQSIRKVVVQIPSSLLESGLVIADTPGFGAAQLGDDPGSHELALKEYLRDEVSQVFWIVLAEQGIGKREKSFHDQLFAEVCDDVIVTGSEDWSQADRERFRQRFTEYFDQRLPAFHFVSGLEGLRARQAHDARRLEAAGITALEARIRALAEPLGRVTATQEALLQLADDLVFWMSELKHRHRSLPSLGWRPDSWSRWREQAASSPFTQQLCERLEECP